MKLNPKNFFFNLFIKYIIIYIMVKYIKIVKYLNLNKNIFQILGGQIWLKDIIKIINFYKI